MVQNTSLVLHLPMNEILKKCIEELAKDAPSIDYVRGMLETLLSMNTTPEKEIFVTKSDARVSPVTDPSDEAAILDAKARAAIESVQAMAQLD